MAKLNDKLEFEQNGKTYSLYNLPDGFVIKGDVDLRNKGLTELPNLSKVIVKGNFYCSDNKLTSLQGAPQEVGGDFRCDNNKLTTLQGAPQRVGEGFYCRSNELTSLTGALREVGGDFECSDNQLKNLQGASQKVGGEFWCDNNQLTSLSGAPQEVGTDFLCYNNQLTTLIGAPKEVGGGFYCGFNNLTSLKGAPQKIGGDFKCEAISELQSLLGISVMPDDKEIRCDDFLNEKYECPLTKDKTFYYKDLKASAVYKNEVHIQTLIQRRHEKNGADMEKKLQDKRKAGFAAFKKMKAEERE